MCHRDERSCHCCVAPRSALYAGVGGLLGTGIGFAMWYFGIIPFINGGAAWHIGLEFVNKMNIIHIGNHPKFGFHIAFGAIEPMVSDLHVYIYPLQYIWRYGSDKAFYYLEFIWKAAPK